MIPDTTLTCPPEDVDVSVDRSSELVNVPDSAKSKYWFGAAVSSSSAPLLTAFGTLKTRRDEQEPAVTINCRSLMSMWNAAALSETFPFIHCVFAPTS